MIGEKLKPDDNKLVQSAINGMLAGLDPHSSYMDPSSLRNMQALTRGEFGGLGIEVTMEDAQRKIVAAQVAEHATAKKVGQAADYEGQIDDARELNKRAIAGRYSEAIPLVQRALAMREKALGPDHPDVATLLNNLASL
jgi:C-terminal processing protease CtpA/Prc